MEIGSLLIIALVIYCAACVFGSIFNWWADKSTSIEYKEFIEKADDITENIVAWVFAVAVVIFAANFIYKSFIT